MKRILILLFILSLNYSCKFGETKDYNESVTIKKSDDTLNIKKIKIKTH